MAVNKWRILRLRCDIPCRICKWIDWNCRQTRNTAKQSLHQDPSLLHHFFRPRQELRLTGPYFQAQLQTVQQAAPRLHPTDSRGLHPLSQAQRSQLVLAPIFISDEQSSSASGLDKVTTRSAR